MNTYDEELILKNTSLAYDLAWKYYNKMQHVFELEDIQSIALLSLTKAATKFKSDRNIKFSTFAYTCIRNDICLYIRDNKKHISIISLSEKIADDDALELQDIIPDSFNLVENIENNFKLDMLNKEIDNLPDRYRLVIRYYLQGKTMNEIADILNLSQPQISRDYHKALNLLRNRFKDWR